MMKEYFALFIKGAGMGAANVVPGVSGGTIALITGIFHKLIDSIKAFDLCALQLLLKGKFKSLARHINLDFLLAVFAGVAVSILSVAKLFAYLFENYPIYIWAFFFGLILASIFFVGKTIKKWDVSVMISLTIGTAIAVAISLLKPASENSSFIYLIICGIVGACSMILPGLSGSFVLILMGNYQLIMIESVNNLNIIVLLPVVLGAGLGLIVFSHFLSWIFKKFENQTIALLTGFILGSLGMIWPWKTPHYVMDTYGMPLLKGGKRIVERYQWNLPDQLDSEFLFALFFIILGILLIWITETLASKHNN